LLFNNPLDNNFKTLFSILAALRTDLILAILPSIISEGATMSAPALAKAKAISAMKPILSSLSITPVSSFMTPQCPSEIENMTFYAHLITAL